MPDPILGEKAPDASILQRIGNVATEWSWIESMLAEMLAFYCRADPGSLYVITQKTASSSQIEWLRVLTQIKVKEPDTAKVILDLLTEIDDARCERNTIVHGIWRGHDTPGFGWVRTINWERCEVVKTELWSSADLDSAAENIVHLQLKLANLGRIMGFLKMD
jgi:hypothetical protein